MNKRVITFVSGIGLMIGSYLPMVFGWDPTGLGGPSILFGLIGGLLGVWLGVVASKWL